MTHIAHAEAPENATANLNLNDEIRMMNGSVGVKQAVDNLGSIPVWGPAPRGSSRASDCGARSVRLCQALSDHKIFKRGAGVRPSVFAALPPSSNFVRLRMATARQSATGRRDRPAARAIIFTPKTSSRSAIFGDIRSNSAIFAHSGKNFLRACRRMPAKAFRRFPVNSGGFRWFPVVL